MKIILFLIVGIDIRYFSTKDRLEGFAYTQPSNLLNNRLQDTLVYEIITQNLISCFYIDKFYKIQPGKLWQKSKT